jgi:hypothetical protein
VSREHLDEFVHHCHKLRRSRTSGIGHIDLCEAEYGTATRALTEVVRRFPGCDCPRYASALRIVELLTDRPNEDIHEQAVHNADTASDCRSLLPRLFLRPPEARVSSFSCSSCSLRGVPATQFDARHFFHLEFITCGPWVPAAVRSHSGSGLDGGSTRVSPASVLRAAVVLAGCVTMLVLTLWAARAYQ